MNIPSPSPNSYDDRRSISLLLELESLIYIWCDWTMAEWLLCPESLCARVAAVALLREQAWKLLNPPSPSLNCSRDECCFISWMTLMELEPANP